MIQIEMQMPVNCDECRFNDREFGYCKAAPVYSCGPVNDSEEGGRPEWCPLKAQEPRVITLEWLEKKRENLIRAAMVHSTVYGDNSVELCHAVNAVLNMWQKEQEAR